MEKIKTKVCKKCGKSKPSTKEYFHIHKGCKDGLNSVCKECRSKIAAKRNRQQIELNNGFKKCVDCGEVLEVNENNFKTKINSLDGFYNVCIKCQIKRRRKGADEGFKKCIKCENILPINRDYFQPTNKCIDGFRNICWKCLGRDYYPDFASESWSEEDINIVKNNYQIKNINDIVLLLSVKRTEKAILHIAQKLGIRKINSYVENYNSLKYKIIDNQLHKYCKNCNRYLPNNFDYFPKDEKCIDKLRNVCRECKGELFRHDSKIMFWTENEINIMLKYYIHYSNSEIIDFFLPYRNISSLEYKAKELNLYKTDETRKRIDILNGIETSIRKLKNKDWFGEDNPQYDSQRFGGLNPNYKGGTSQLYQELRRNIKQWKFDSMENCNFKCFLSNDKFDHIHHLYSFDLIVQDTLNETGLSLYENISQYSDIELKQLVDKCLEIHYRHPLGLCLSEKYHVRFHLEFGYGNNTEEQFYEFVENYYNGKYKDLI